MRIGLPTDVTRRTVAETVTALWTFANAAGLLTDDINERTGGAGVTIDGVLLLDTTISLLGFASPANRVYGSDVLGDLDERFRLHAGGTMQWGDGGGARDTELRRDAADELGTPDDFNVGGALDLAGDIELSERTIVLAAGGNHDIATAAVTVQRLDSSAGAATLTGFAGGRVGRLLCVANVDVGLLVLTHQDVLSVAANRMILPNGINVNLAGADGIMLWYDDAVSRWRTFSSNP